MHSIMPIKRQVMQLHPPISMTSIIAMHETHDKDKERVSCAASATVPGPARKSQTPSSYPTCAPITL